MPRSAASGRRKHADSFRTINEHPMPHKHDQGRTTSRAIFASVLLHLFAESRAYGGVAVLSETHLEGNVQGHGVLVLGKTLDDGDRLLHSFIRAGREKICQQGVANGRGGGGLFLVSLSEQTNPGWWLRSIRTPGRIWSVIDVQPDFVPRLVERMVEYHAGWTFWGGCWEVYVGGVRRGDSADTETFANMTCDLFHCD